MLRSEAARYARWSAIVAIVLSSLTALAYFRRDWVRHIEKKNAPPPAPVDVSRQSAGINFKKVEQNRTIFDVAASKSTEFKGHDANLLEDVRITIYGKTGERHDVIHTRSCEYGRENGGISCTGDVNIELMTAADAERVAAHPAIANSLVTQIGTRGVTFDRASGLAQTNQKVTFAFPSGNGEAVGLEYNSEEGTVRLLRDVHFKLTQAQASPGSGTKRNPSSLSRNTQEVQVTGSGLDFGRDTRLLRLFGPAEARTATQLLTAAEIKLSLNPQFQAETLLASGSGASRPTVSSVRSSAPASSSGTTGVSSSMTGTSATVGDSIKLEADSLTAHFSPQGAVIKLDASGSVHGVCTAPNEEEQATADAGSLELSPWLGRPKELNLNGNVLLRTQSGKGEARLLRTSAFRMKFSAENSGQATKLQIAETLAPGTMEWTDAPAQPGGVGIETKLRGDTLTLNFADTGKARQLLAKGNVQTERLTPGKQSQSATARAGVVELQPTGGWSQMILDGDVRLKEGERSGEGAHAVFVRESQTATLTGKVEEPAPEGGRHNYALVRDATTETRAPRVIFFQATGDIQAEGGVRSTDFSARSSAVQLAPAPANITADRLQANSKTGRALYLGHAHLWQGDSVLEADTIELLPDARVLNASGNVRAVFPQTPMPTQSQSIASRRSAITNAVTPASLPGAAPRTHLWHVSSGTLTYSDKENRAHLEQNVIVQSAEQKMRAPILDLYFSRSSYAASQTADGRPGGGAQQVSRALGTGGVTVEEGTRKATAEHGEYVASDGKFVMSGGNPTLYDGLAGTTTGRQLTFFLADDTIIVDSENGSRTLTKHRVEK